MSALRRYLAYVVHGRKIQIERKPRRSGPALDWKYRAWVRSLPCCACGSLRYIEAAHTGDDGGMSQKASDYSCVPLCALCHRINEWTPHQIGKQAFDQKFGSNFARLVKRLNRPWRLMLDGRL